MNVYASLFNIYKLTTIQVKRKKIATLFEEKRSDGQMTAGGIFPLTS